MVPYDINSRFGPRLSFIQNPLRIVIFSGLIMGSSVELRQIRVAFDFDISTGQNSAPDWSGITEKLQDNEKSTIIIISPNRRYKTFKVLTPRFLIRQTSTRIARDNDIVECRE